MKFEQLLENKSYLYEGLDSSALRTVKLWESAGQKILEAQLTADQIQQLFKSVEKDSTDAGGNRTMIGKGKDVTDAVGKAWTDLKAKMENSKPMTNFDQAMSDQLSKIGMGAKDPQFHGKVSDWVQKYRDFAKQHPIAQGAIYATLVALSGLLTAGVGSIAAIGLLKLADKVLQGDRFSAALGSAAKTAAAAWGASELGKLGHGADQTPAGSPAPTDSAMPPDSAYNTTSHMQYDYNGPAPTMDQIQNTPEFQQVLQHYLSQGVNPVIAGRYASGAGKAAFYRAAGTATNLANESKRRYKKLSILEIRAVIGSVAIQEAGVWDTVKGAAGQAVGAVADKAKTVGHNLTTKVTADKLQSAWAAAGSPTDSEAVKQILVSAGVDAGVVDKVYAELKIPASGTTDNKQTDAPNLGIKEIEEIIAKLRKRDLESLQKELTSILSTATA
jgi:hypothetical protein